MKQSKRNRANEQRKAEERAGRKPVTSAYAAKVRKQFAPDTALREALLPVIEGMFERGELAEVRELDL